MSKVIFENHSIEELRKLSATHPQLVKKIFDLIDDIMKHPFEGIGKPEPLKHDYKGYWSRRITNEHRLIYKIDSEKNVIITALHGHHS